MLSIREKFLALFATLAVVVTCAACSPGAQTAGESAGSEAPAASQAAESPAAESPAATEPADEQEAASSEEASAAAAVPNHAGIGEWQTATRNLEVRVISVAPGPYDYADDGPTVMVTVAMHNMSDHVIRVKPSNWDADNTWGQRVDHKISVKDENGRRVARSFKPTSISPGATYEAVVYFDGEGLVSVIYEPHWLVSPESDFLFFDI